MVMSATAWLTRLKGETSTACLRTVPRIPTPVRLLPPRQRTSKRSAPWDPMRVESSRGPQATTASTKTWIGFWSVRRWTISKACATMRTAILKKRRGRGRIMRTARSRRKRWLRHKGKQDSLLLSGVAAVHHEAGGGRGWGQQCPPAAPGWSLLPKSSTPLSPRRPVLPSLHPHRASLHVPLCASHPCSVLRSRPVSGRRFVPPSLLELDPYLLTRR